MQQYAVECMLHILIAVYSVLYCIVSLRQCSAFAGIACGVSIHALYLAVFAVGACLCSWTLINISQSSACSDTCSATCTFIVNACNNALSHAINFCRSIYIYMINLNVTYVYS